jgi:3-methyl-2-oxobutanoate hydroxymethyltransferase
VVVHHKRPTVADIRAMKARGQKISMLYVTTLEEAQAAAAAGIHMLSIEGRFFSAEMREAAGDCFVQVGLPYGPFGNLATPEDYLRAAFSFMAIGGDCFYCAASLDIQKTLCDNAVPVVAHVGLIPSQNTWTGGFKAVGKTAESAKAVWDHVKRLEAIGCFGAELEVVPDRVAEAITRSTPMIMLGWVPVRQRTRNISSPRTCSATPAATSPDTPRPTATSRRNTTASSRNGSLLSGSSWPT